MTNTKLFLLLGTSLSLVPQTMSAAECAVTDCSLLGYTDSACPGSGLKCPFGEGWYCGGGAAEDCIKLGYDKDCTGAGESGSGQTCNGKYLSCTCDSSYKYTCTGTGYSGGSGTACGGKYTSCTCASGYEWKDGTCQQQIINGPDGDVYKCNGIVVGIKTADMNFYVAMKDLGFLGCTDANSQCLSYVFCGNVKGTMPTKDQLVSLYNNKSQVNTLLSTNGGTQLTNAFYWSSTFDAYYGGYYIVNISDGSGAWDYFGARYVRPVLTSW